jgi:hypothetical protein
MAGDHSVAGYLSLTHPEIGAAVLHQRISLLETALVKKPVDALTGSQLVLRMLAVDLVLAATRTVRCQPFL